MNNENIDIEKLNRLKKRLCIAEDNNNYVYIEGVGFAFETGKLNLEGLVKRLLKSKYITNPMFWNDESKDKVSKKGK